MSTKEDLKHQEIFAKFIETIDDSLLKPNENKWEYIPEVLMNEKCWFLGAAIDNPFEPGKRPHYISHGNTPVPASISVESQYMTYDEAVSHAEGYGLNLGFVHTHNLGIATLDADIKDNTPDHVIQKIYELFNEFDTYVELSNSGKGLHAILRTEQLVSIHPKYPEKSPIPLEIYSYNRFMLTTGREVRFVVNSSTDNEGNEIKRYEIVELTEHEYDDMYRKIPAYRDEKLIDLISQIGGNAKDTTDLVEVEAILSDEEVLSKIYDSHLGLKFGELSVLPPDFEFHTIGYPSCSEVDLAVIGIICQFTESNEQTRRIFKDLPIAQRPKHQKNQYHINRALIRVRTELLNKRAEALETEKALDMFLTNINERIKLERDALKKCNDNSDKLDIEPYNPTNDFENAIPFPHGLAGDMCRYLMDIAPHKLAEAALAGTLATLSAILGRQYQINGAGLNNYYVVVSSSATGKETARRGVGRFASVMASVGGDKFFCFDTMASKQAYLSFFGESETFSHLVFVPEFSKYVSAMQQKQNGLYQQIYSLWLEIFPRSAKGDVNGGNLRAKAEDSTGGVKSPALTLLCDTTGDDYYEQITETMQKDGFMSRFVNIECYNPIKKLSDKECHKVVMPEHIATELQDLASYVLKLKEKGDAGYIDVQVEPSIRKHICSFELYTLEMVNKTRDERYRQPYNRCFLKIMTVASLLAITRNKFQPVINMEDFEWAKSLIMRDVYNIVRKLNNGTFGVSEDNNEKIVKHEIKRILFKGTRTEVENVKYGALLDKGVIPRSAISVRINQYSNFGRQNQSKIDVFDRIMFNFEKNGWVRRIDKHNRITEFKALGWEEVPFYGDCFALQNGTVFAEGAVKDTRLVPEVKDESFYEETELPTIPQPIRAKRGRKPKSEQQSEGKVK